MSNLACDISSRCFFLVKFLIVAFRSSRLPGIGGFHLYLFPCSFFSSMTFQSSKPDTPIMQFFGLGKIFIECIREPSQITFAFRGG